MDFKFGKNKTAVLIVIGIFVLLSSFLIDSVLKILLYMAFTAISGAMTYALGKARSPIDIAPTFFFMIVISLGYGFWYAVPFVIFVSTIPTILGEGDLTFGTFLFMGAFIFFCFLAKSFDQVGIVPLGIGLTIANLAFGGIVQFMENEPGSFIYSIIHTIVTIMYFVTLGNLLMGIL